MEALSLASEKSWSLALTDDSAPDDFNSLFLTSLECNVLTALVFLSPRSPAPFLQYCVVFSICGNFQRLLCHRCCHTLGCNISPNTLVTVLVVLSSHSCHQHNHLHNNFGQVIGFCWTTKYYFTAAVVGVHLSLITTSLITTYEYFIKWPLGGIKDKY